MTVVLLWLILAVPTLIIISIVWPGIIGAPWIPSTRAEVRRMLTLAHVQPGERVYDLGSGDGRVLIAVAREFDAEAIGVEADLLRWLWTQARVRLLNLRGPLTGHVRVIWGNLFEADLRTADVVIVYLRQDTNTRLMHKLWRELRPGARVISNTYIFPGREAARVDTEGAPIYCYEIEG